MSLSSPRSNLTATTITYNNTKYAVFAGGVDNDGVGSKVIDFIYIT